MGQTMMHLSLPRLLAFHQSLFALTVFMAALPFNYSDGLTAIVAILNTLVWLFVTGRRVGSDSLGLFRRASPLLWIPALYFLAVSIFYVVKGEISPTSQFAGFLTYALTLWIAAHVFGVARDARVAFGMLTCAGLAVCAVAVFLLLTRGTPRELLQHGPFWSGYGLSSTAVLGVALMDSNALATLLILFTSLALGLWATAETRPTRLFAAVSLLCFAVGVYLTGSRGGAPFFVILWLAWLGRRGKSGRRAAGIGATAVLTGVGLALARHAGGLLRGDGNLKSRFHMWRASARLARHHPIFGGGRGGFREEWSRYGPAYGYGNTVMQPDGLFWSLLAEGGLLLVTMAGLLLFGLTREILTVLKQPGRQTSRELLTAFALGFAAALGHEFLETTFRKPVIALLLCLLGGLTLGTKTRQSQKMDRLEKATHERHRN